LAFTAWLYPARPFGAASVLTISFGMARDITAHRHQLGLCDFGLEAQRVREVEGVLTALQLRMDDRAGRDRSQLLDERSGVLDADTVSRSPHATSDHPLPANGRTLTGRDGANE
jgi:hypothetical protein